MADEANNGLYQFTGFGTDGPVGYGYTPTATYQTTPGMGLSPAQNALVDPTYLAQLDILNRPQVGNFQFSPMGSGVASVQGTGAAPAYPTASEAGSAQPGGGAAYTAGGDYSGDTNPAWSSMTPAEQAAYYAANPTMAAITQAMQTGFGYTMPGLLSQMANPQGWGEAATIARGMDPTGMQFGSPGLSIGGLQVVAPTVPDLVAQNVGPYGWQGGDIGTGISTPTGYYTGYDVSSNSGGDWSGGNGGGYADSYGSTSYGGEAYGDSPAGTY